MTTKVKTGTKGIYKFNWDCGRQGDLEGVFVATAEDVAKVIGKEVYFGEVLGKHSEVYGDLQADEIKLVSDNQEFVKLFEDNNLETGHNPITTYFERLEEEGEDDDETAE